MELDFFEFVEQEVPAPVKKKKRPAPRKRGPKHAPLHPARPATSSSHASTTPSSIPQAETGPATPPPAATVERRGARTYAVVGGGYKLTISKATAAYELLTGRTIRAPLKKVLQELKAFLQQLEA